MKIYLVYGVHEENTLIALFKDKKKAERYIDTKPLLDGDYIGMEYYSYMIKEMETMDDNV